MLRDADDMRHALADALDRESLFLTVPLPDEGLNVHVYWWVDGEGRAGRVAGVFSDHDRRLLFDLQDGVDARGRDFDDWDVAGLRARHTRPLEVAHVGYQGDGVAFEIEFEAIHRAFAYSENRGGAPRAMGDDRFEQSGRVRGELRLPDRTIRFDTTGHRDHSWGRRDYQSIHHFKWISAQTGTAEALNAFQLLSGGEQTVNGYLYRDRALSPLVAMRSSVEYGERFVPRTMMTTVEDELGRTAVVHAERFSHLRWGAGSIVMDDFGCRVDVDGRSGAAHAGLAWTRDYVDGRLAPAAGKMRAG
jgi:hypothetical protein